MKKKEFKSFTFEMAKIKIRSHTVTVMLNMITKKLTKIFATLFIVVTTKNLVN